MEIPRHWRLKAQRYRLEGSTCSNCGQRVFPPRPVCSHCNANPVQNVRLIISGLLSSTSFAEVETHIGHQITERLIP